MPKKNCPLCGGKLKNNYCESCGYDVPDESELSALYNYDPSDYPQEEPKIREIAPDPFMEEIYPNRENPPKFKVRDDEGKTVNDRNGASPYANPPKQEYKSPNPYANDGTFKPYQNPPNNGQQNGQQNGQPFQNPYANNGNFTPYTNPTNSSDGSFAEFLKKYWIILLIMLLMPRFLSLILGISFFRNVKNEDEKYRKYYIISVIICCIFSLY